jgi:amidase
MANLELDALLFPGSSSAGIAAKPGYPTVMVPFGFLESSTRGMPEGFDPKPRPNGVSFTGSACSEPTLLQLAYAFEQASLRRIAPPGMH